MLNRSAHAYLVGLFIGLNLFTGFAFSASSSTLTVSGVVPETTEFSLQNFSVNSVFNGIGSRAVTNQVVADLVLNSNDLNSNSVTLISENDGVLKNDSAPNSKIDYFVSVNDLTSQSQPVQVRPTKSGVDVCSSAHHLGGVADLRYSVAISIPKQSVDVAQCSDRIIVQLANL